MGSLRRSRRIWQGRDSSLIVPVEPFRHVLLSCYHTRADRIVQRVRGAVGDVLLSSSGHFRRVLAARWIGAESIVGRSFMLSTASLSALSHEDSVDEPPFTCGTILVISRRQRSRNRLRAMHAQTSQDTVTRIPHHIDRYAAPYENSVLVAAERRRARRAREGAARGLGPRKRPSRGVGRSPTLVGYTRGVDRSATPARRLTVPVRR
jgi:hypothetical protein